MVENCPRRVAFLAPLHHRYRTPLVNLHVVRTGSASAERVDREIQKFVALLDTLVAANELYNTEVLGYDANVSGGQLTVRLKHLRSQKGCPLIGADVHSEHITLWYDAPVSSTPNDYVTLMITLASSDRVAALSKRIVDGVRARSQTLWRQDTFRRFNQEWYNEPVSDIRDLHFGDVIYFRYNDWWSSDFQIIDFACPTAYPDKYYPAVLNFSEDDLSVTGLLRHQKTIRDPEKELDRPKMFTETPSVVEVAKWQKNFKMEIFLAQRGSDHPLAEYPGTMQRRVVATPVPWEDIAKVSRESYAAARRDLHDFRRSTQIVYPSI